MTDLTRLTKEDIQFLLIDRAFGFLTNLVRYGAFAWIAWCLYGAVGEMAGKETLASFFVEVIADKVKTHWLTISLALFAIIWAMGERTARRQTVKRLSRRIQELECLLDPKRSSSGIQSTGDTNPKDMP